MYSDYEIIKEDNGTFSAKLECNGMKAYNSESEELLIDFMRSLDGAYAQGVNAGEKFAKQEIASRLGL